MDNWAQKVIERIQKEEARFKEINTELTKGMCLAFNQCIEIIEEYRDGATEKDPSETQSEIKSVSEPEVIKIEQDPKEELLAAASSKNKDIPAWDLDTELYTLGFNEATRTALQYGKFFTVGDLINDDRLGKTVQVADIVEKLNFDRGMIKNFVNVLDRNGIPYYFAYKWKYITPLLDDFNLSMRMMNNKDINKKLWTRLSEYDSKKLWPATRIILEAHGLNMIKDIIGVKKVTIESFKNFKASNMTNLKEFLLSIGFTYKIDTDRWDDKKVSEFFNPKLDKRYRNALVRAGYITVGDILRTSPAQIKENTRCFGEIGLAELSRVLREVGISDWS